MSRKRIASQPPRPRTPLVEVEGAAPCGDGAEQSSSPVAAPDDGLESSEKAIP